MIRARTSCLVIDVGTLSHYDNGNLWNIHFLVIIAQLTYRLNVLKREAEFAHNYFHVYVSNNSGYEKYFLY